MHRNSHYNKKDGKNYIFNSEAFENFVIKKKDEINAPTKKQVYAEIANLIYPNCKCSDDEDFSGHNMDAIRKWGEKSGPTKMSDIQELMKYFNCKYEEIMKVDNSNDNERSQKMEIKQESIIKECQEIKSEKKNVAEKKFNSLQKEVFIKIMNLILDYVYSVYSPVMGDYDIQVEIAENGNLNDIFNLENSAKRIIYKQRGAKNYFSQKELDIIEEAKTIEDEYYERNPKWKLLNEVEDDEFIKNNKNKMQLLEQYKIIRDYGDFILLRQEIDKTLSVLPYEVYEKLKNLLYYIPEKYWFTFDMFGCQELDYNIDNAQKPNRLKYVEYHKNDEMSDFYLDSEIHDRIMYIHKIFNGIVNAYID